MKTEPLIVGLIGAIALVGLAGIFALLAQRVPVPEGVVVIVSGATGALGSMLNHITRPNAQEVTVTNSNANPVPTDPQ